MEKCKSVVRQLEFHLLLFAAGLILFVQPLLVASTRVHPEGVLWLLFISWGALIVLLFFVSLSYRARRMSDEEVGLPDSVRTDEGSGIDARPDGGRARGE